MIKLSTIKSRFTKIFNTEHGSEKYFNSLKFFAPKSSDAKQDIWKRITFKRLEKEEIISVQNDFCTDKYLLVKRPQYMKRASNGLLPEASYEYVIYRIGMDNKMFSAYDDTFSLCPVLYQLM